MWETVPLFHTIGSFTNGASSRNRLNNPGSSGLTDSRFTQASIRIR